MSRYKQNIRNINGDVSDYWCSNIIDQQRRTKTNMTAKEQTLIEFDSWKHKLTEAGWTFWAANKTFYTVHGSIFNKSI